MTKVIKRFSKFTAEMQDLIYDLYSSGGLERTSFPYQNEISQGVIYEEDDQLFLIPVSSITEYRSGSSAADDDDDDDDNTDDVIDEVDAEDDSDVDTDEE